MPRYTHLTPNLNNGSIFTRDHIAHLEAGITGAEAYADEAAAKVQAGDINPEVLNAAIDQAVVDGRIPTSEPLPDLTVTETAEGVYNIGAQGQVLGLTEGKRLPAAAKEDLATTFPTTVSVATDLEAPATLIGGAAGRLIKAVRDALTPGNGARPVGRGELHVSARDFGAVGDGMADDTVALQSFLDHITANKAAGFMPGTNYRITAPLVIRSRPGWSLSGTGNRGTLITQDTDNVPVVQLGDADGVALHHFTIRGLWLTYKNYQPATNTNANAILHYDMAWQATFDDIGVKRGHYGSTVRAGIGMPWGTSWDNIHFGDDLSGGAMDWSAGINAVPNNAFGRFFVELGPMSKTVFHLRGYNFTWDTLEIIEADADTPKLFVLMNGTKLRMGTFKVENSPLIVGKQLVEVQGNSYVDIGHASWNGGGRGSANLTSGTAYLFSLGSSSSADANVRVGRLEAYLSADSTSPLYIYRTGNVDASFHVDQPRLANGWKMVNAASNPDAVNTLTVGEWNNNKVTTRGDGDYTVATRDATVSRFTTQFTAPRTIALPTDGNNLHTGLAYEFVFDGALASGGSATIKAGSTTLRTVSTDKTSLRYTYQQGPGWVLTRGGETATTTSAGVAVVDRGQRLAAKLELGTDDANVYLAGDSTGNENIEWFRLGVTALMAQYPALSADYRLWDDTTKTYGAPQVLQTGNAGGIVTATTFSDSFNRTATDLVGTTPETGTAWTGGTGKNWTLDGTKAVRASTAASDTLIATGSMTGDQTVTVTGVSLSTVAAASAKDLRIIGKYVSSANYVYISIGVNTSGVPSVTVAKRVGNTATNMFSIASGLPASTASTTFDVVLKVEGLTVTATVNGVTGTGTLTQADADALAPATAAALYGSVATAGTTVDGFKVDTTGVGSGSKTVHFYNGSLSGSNLTYQSGQMPAIMPATPDLVIISSAHNYGAHTGETYIPFVTDFVKLVEDTYPGKAGFIVGSQNPRFAPATFNTEYHKRLTAIRAEALARGWGYLPVLEAFRARGDGGQSYVKSDGVHPTTSTDAPNPDNGSALWSRVFLNYMDSLKQPVVS